MKPIKKGMTEAITRDGRKVTQLTWLECKDKYNLHGVVDGIIQHWKESGRYFNENDDSNLDIFAIPEYEYQAY